MPTQQDKFVGDDKVINGQSINVDACDDNGFIIECHGTVTLTPGGRGFAPGCEYRRDNGDNTTTTFLNQGDHTSCDFVESPGAGGGGVPAGADPGEMLRVDNAGAAIEGNGVFEMRPMLNRKGVGSVIYVETTGDDDTGDGTSVGTAYATISRALEDIGTLNPSNVTIQCGVGVFDMPNTLSEANWITLLGTESVQESRTISAVDTLSDQDGIALTIDGGPFADDVLRGRLIKWTSGAAAGEYGWIYRNVGNQIFVTNENETAIPAIVATDTFDIMNLDTSFNYTGIGVMMNSTQLNIQKANIIDGTVNGLPLFMLSSDKQEFRYCFWSINRPQVGGYGRAIFWCNYIATKGGTARGVYAGRNESNQLFEKGTVIDASLNTTAANKRFMEFSAGAVVGYKGMVVVRGIEDAKGIQCDGVRFVAVGGIDAHDTWRFETEGATASNFAGFVINTTGEGKGGSLQLPNLQGEVTSDYCVTAEGGALVILGETSNIVTATVVNAVNAQVTALIPSPFNHDGTLIIGGALTSTGFLFMHDSATLLDAIPTVSFDDLVIGGIMKFTSNSPDANTRTLVRIENLNSAAGGASCLFIDQNANNTAVVIDSESTTSIVFSLLTATTTGTGLFISGNNLTTGTLANITSNSANTSIRDVAVIAQESASATQARVLRLKQDSLADALFIDKNSFGNAVHIQQDIFSVAVATGLYVDVANTGAGASLALHAVAGHIVVGSPVTHVTDRAIHTFGVNNGIQFERSAGVEGIIQMDSGNRFEINSTNDIIIGPTGNHVFFDISANQILLGDPFGDTANIFLTIDNTTGYIRVDGKIGMGTSAPNRRLHLAALTTFDGIQLENTNNESVFIQLATGPNAVFQIAASPGGVSRMDFGDPGVAVNLDITNSQVVVGDRAGDLWNGRITVDNATANPFIANSVATAIGQDTAPGADAMLEIVSTTKGFRPPVMTEAQRDAIASPTEGLIVYNSDTDSLDHYDGTAWDAISVTEHNYAEIYSALTQNIIVPGEFQVLIMGSSDVVDGLTHTVKQVTAATISFTAPNQIDDSGSGFGTFEAGDIINITGSASNDGMYTVQSATAAQIITVENTIVVEAAGASVTLETQYLLCNQAGVYQISGFSHMTKTAAGSSLFEFRFSINSTPSRVFTELLTTTNEIKSISGTGKAALSAGDKLFAQWTAGASAQVVNSGSIGTPQAARLSVMRIA